MPSLADSSQPPSLRASASRSSRKALAALGIHLARRGFLASTAITLAGLTTLIASIAAFVLARKGPRAPLAELPSVTSSALAWGAGFTLAFVASMHAFRRDRTDGIRALIAARGGSRGSYVWGRVGGLAILLSLVVGGGTVVAGILATLLAARVGLAANVVQGTIASLAYAIAFSCTITPIALAALGGRTRSGGYFWILVVVLLPELLERGTSSVLPSAYRELVSIPSALGALRSALMPPGVDVARGARAAAVLGVVCATALLVVRREIARLDAEQAS